MSIVVESLIVKNLRMFQGKNRLGFHEETNAIVGKSGTGKKTLKFSFNLCLARERNKVQSATPLAPLPLVDELDQNEVLKGAIGLRILDNHTQHRYFFLRPFQTILLDDEPVDELGYLHEYRKENDEWVKINSGGSRDMVFPRSRHLFSIYTSELGF